MDPRDLDLAKGEAKDKIGQLVKDYSHIVATGNKGAFNEERVKIAFVVPMLETLGWNPRTDEVLPEQATLVGRADFGLKVGGRIKLFVEMKSFNKSLDGHDIVKGAPRSYVEQAIQYAWGMQADWAILTNFEETRLYYSHVRRPQDGLVWKKPLKYVEYESRLDDLWLVSKESVASGALDCNKARAQRPPVNEAFLRDLTSCRQLLAEDIRAENPGLTYDGINDSVQKILDRIIFIKNCEDRSIIPAESLWKRFKAWRETSIDPSIVPFMMDLKSLFRYFDEVYNGKLFEKNPCEDLKISNEVFEEIINILYGDGGEHLGYNFGVIPINVLGQAYELYIGSILKEKEGAGKAIEIVKEPAKRKAYGIYYTPAPIVNMIVENTLDRVLRGCESIEDLSRTKVLDPACGSGSFLIKAFDTIRDWYSKHNEVRHRNEASIRSVPFETLDTHLVTSLNIEGKILNDNMFGVDLDPQAVEITILNLSLKSILSKRKLPYIGDHIRCGNTLVSGHPDDLARYFEDPPSKKPFDWQKEFEKNVPHGVFDVIISNPPYLTMENLPEYQDYFRAKFAEVYSGKNDIHYYFIARGLQLLREKGYLGYITSRYFMEAAFARKLRSFILRNSRVKAIIDFGNAQVFEGVNVLTSIIILQKISSKDPADVDSNIVRIVRVKSAECDIVSLAENIRSHLDQGEFSDSQIDVFNINQSDLTEDSWKLQPQKTTHILSKLESSSWRLGELCEIEQSQKTGLNEAFCVSEAYAERTHLEKQLLRRVVKNSDILRYYVDWKHKYLIYTTDETRIDEYPNIKKHLEKYKKELESRSECKDGLYEWFRLQRPRRVRLFNASQKIIVPFLSTENRFAHDDEAHYGTADTYVIVPKRECSVDLRYILALLNSRLLEFYHKSTAKLKRGEYYEYLRGPLSNIPIRKVNLQDSSEKTRYDEIIALSQKAMSVRRIYYETLHLFDRILANFKDSLTKYGSFQKDYFALGSGYDIDLSGTEKLVDDSVQGEITEIQVKEIGECIVLQARYITQDGKEIFGDIGRVQVCSREMRTFFYYSMKSFLMKKYKVPTWGKGPVWETVTHALEIPRFAANIESNRDRIRLLITEFLKSCPIWDENLTDLEVRFHETEMLISTKVFDLYNVSKEEIAQVDSFIERQRKYISRTI